MRGWKWVGAGLAVVTFATAGILQWRNRRESAAKVVLAAEIRAERAARARPADQAPTDVERETAERYRLAVFALQTDGCFEEGFCNAIEGVPWSAVPEPVAAVLTANAPCLALADAAAARGACRFEDASLQSKSRCHILLTVMAARGHAALAAGDPLAAVEDVRRLLRVGRDLAAVPVRLDEELVWPWSDTRLLTAEQRAAVLLSAVATAPDLPTEAGPALAAAGREPWGSSAAIRRNIDAHADFSDIYSLHQLAPDAAAWLAGEEARVAEFDERMTSAPSKQSLLEKAEVRIRKALGRRTEVPTAADVRAYRELRAPILAAVRRRDIAALAPGSPFDETAWLMGYTSAPWFRHALVEEARVAVARAAAAVRAFRLAEGRLPRSLEELVPSVLREVPLDPRDGNPLLYEIDGDGWRVASRVWPDPLNSADGTVEEYPRPEVRFPRSPK